MTKNLQLELIVLLHGNNDTSIIINNNHFVNIEDKNGYFVRRLVSEECIYDSSPQNPPQEQYAETTQTRYMELV